LPGLLYLPPAGAHHVQRAVVVAPGVGIPARFYQPFAEWLAQFHGAAVLLFNYSGIGATAPQTRAQWKAFRHPAHFWATTDLDAAVQYLAQQYPEKPRTLLAHSFGGQVLGLLPHGQLLHAAVFVASGTGSRQHYDRRTRLWQGIMWRGLLPLYGTTRGYLPHWVMGGEHVPASMARDWKRWCHHPDYLQAFIGKEGPGGIPARFDHYREINLPIHAWHFSDDRVISRGGVEHLLGFYPHAHIERHFHTPADFGLDSVGHVGMFRPKAREALWQHLAAGLAGTAAGASLAALTQSPS
jgi:predicted alpha/beta hydrolase